MKKLVTGILASLLLANTLPALADPYGHRRHFRPPPPVVHHHHRHDRHGHPLAWGIAGLALGGILYSTIAPPPPAVVVAPPPASPPGRHWYYCESYRAYYPQVQYCPEGWRAVPGY